MYDNRETWPHIEVWPPGDTIGWFIRISWEGDSIGKEGTKLDLGRVCLEYHQQEGTLHWLKLWFAPQLT